MAICHRCTQKSLIMHRWISLPAYRSLWQSAPQTSFPSIGILVMLWISRSTLFFIYMFFQVNLKCIHAGCWLLASWVISNPYRNGDIRLSSSLFVVSFLCDSRPDTTALSCRKACYHTSVLNQSSDVSSNAICWVGDVIKIIRLKKTQTSFLSKPLFFVYFFKPAVDFFGLMTWVFIMWCIRALVKNKTCDVESL